MHGFDRWKSGSIWGSDLNCVPKKVICWALSSHCICVETRLQRNETIVSGWCQLKYFWFSPQKWGRWTHFDSFFFQGVGSTTSYSRFVEFLVGFGKPYDFFRWSHFSRWWASSSRSNTCRCMGTKIHERTNFSECVLNSWYLYTNTNVWVCCNRCGYIDLKIVSTNFLVLIRHDLF